MTFKLVCLILLGYLWLIRHVWGQANKQLSEKNQACSKPPCSCCLNPSTCNNGTCDGPCVDGIFGGRCLTYCPSNCVACQDPDNPTNNASLWGVANCTSCKPGYYSTSEYFQCQLQCPAPCSACTSETECTSCYTGYYQTGHICSLCPIGCASCSSPSQCTRCRDNYYISSTVNGNINCTSCSKGCLSICNKTSGRCSCKTSYIGDKCDSCKSGWFGIKSGCQSQCPISCINCSSISECTSCADGFNIHGTSCQPCQIGCSKCSPLDTCQQCKNGYYMHNSGKDCTQCSTGCASDCNQLNGSCSCNIGFTGEKCDQCATNIQPDIHCNKCIEGFYGSACERRCLDNCKSNVCDKDSGLCTAGCNGNFAADACTSCINGWHGSACDAKCPSNCLRNSCEQFTGICQNCTGNFAGSTCDSCVTGYYGINCGSPCPSNCENATCNSTSGHCYSCKSQFSGDMCCLNGTSCISCLSESICFECVPGKYGDTCDYECPENCERNICDKVKGTCSHCSNGFKGLLCSLPLTGHISPSGISAPAIAGGVACLVIFTAVVAVLVVFFKRRIKNQHSKTSYYTDDEVTDRGYENDTDVLSASSPYATINNLEPPSVVAYWKKEDTTPLHTKEPDTGDQIVTPRGSKTTKASLKAPRAFSERPDSVPIDDDNEFFQEDGESDYYNSEAIIEKGISVAELAAYVDQKDFDFFNKEFKKLPKGLAKPANTASLEHNIGKNRYNEIYPYDETRVVLEGPGTDFINACYIDGYRKKRQYIASFGPIARATERYQTFWRMVWQEKTGKIVMVTNLMENGGMKCEQYWPDKNATLAYGDVKVTCHSEDVYAEYTVRSFTIRKGKEQRPLLHLHFTAWPDKGVPDDVTSLVEFRNKVNSTKTKLQGPIIVHCSAGVGRTGTYIALDILTNQGKQKGFIDIFACVEKMRQQRTCMVQTADQYDYLHRALVHTLTLGSDAIPADRLIDYTMSLSEAIFGRLSQCTESVSIDEMEAIARNKELTAYNRQGADIPGNFNRPRLYYDRSPRDNKYINAIFVNSFRLNNQFILAQTPLPNTVDDFLTLVLQENCCCIVSMDASNLLDKSIGTYLPADNQVLHTDSFDVRSTMLESNRSYIQRALTIKYKVNSSSITVQHFLCANWSENARTPKSPQDFMTFVKQIQKVAYELTQLSPIIVHCLSGSERSALLCVVLSLLQKTEIEHQVNITNTVRQVKVRRPKAIPNTEQFKFCHQCVSAYLQSFDTYSNFS